MSVSQADREEHLRWVFEDTKDAFVCYECKDGNCAQCIGVPCMCPCPVPEHVAPDNFADGDGI